MAAMPHEHWMRRALDLARQAEASGEVPVGALLVLNDQIIGEGCNQPISQHDATAHAEVIAIRQAGQRLGNYRLTGSLMYVTLEPCLMCVGALLHARIAQVIYGAADPKSGCVHSLYALGEQNRLNHQFSAQRGVLAEDCGELLRAFFRSRRGTT